MTDHRINVRQVFGTDYWAVQPTTCTCQPCERLMRFLHKTGRDDTVWEDNPPADMHRPLLIDTRVLAIAVKGFTGDGATLHVEIPQRDRPLPKGWAVAVDWDPNNPETHAKHELWVETRPAKASP